MKHQQGLSLVEVMISSAIAILVLTGVSNLFINANTTAGTTEALSRIQENARYAFKTIGDDIARAGSYGCLSHAQAPDGLSDSNLTATDSSEEPYIENRLPTISPTFNTYSSLVAGNNAADADSRSDFEWAFVSGENGTGPNGADTLTLKYADSAQVLQVSALTNTDITTSTAVSNVGGIADDDIIIVADCLKAFVLQTSAAAAGTSTTISVETASDLATDFSPTTVPTYVYAGRTGAHTYAIGNSSSRPASTACTTNPLYCSLYRTSDNGAAQELVTGVSNLNITYYAGTNSTGNLAGIADAATIRSYMENIDRVRVALTVVAPDPDAANERISRSISRVFAIRNQL